MGSRWREVHLQEEFRRERVILWNHVEELQKRLHEEGEAGHESYRPQDTAHVNELVQQLSHAQQDLNQLLEDVNKIKKKAAQDRSKYEQVMDDLETVTRLYDNESRSLEIACEERIQLHRTISTLESEIMYLSEREALLEEQCARILESTDDTIEGNLVHHLEDLQTQLDVAQEELNQAEKTYLRDIHQIDSLKQQLEEKEAEKCLLMKQSREDEDRICFLEGENQRLAMNEKVHLSLIEELQLQVEETRNSLARKKRKGSSQEEIRGGTPPSKVQRISESNKQSSPQSVVVTFSGFKEDSPSKYQKRKLMKIVHQLKGKVVDQLDESVTHLVTPPGCRTLKTLTASLDSIWIMNPSWLMESRRATRFADEEGHGRRHTNSPFAGKKFFLSSVFKRDSARAQVCQNLVSKHGEGKILSQCENADYVVISSSELLEPAHPQQSCLTWLQLIEMIPN